MAKDPGLGYQVMATIKELKGKCSAGHQAGDIFEISCHNPAGLCGWFYNNIFPVLQTFQFGGTLPWWKGDVIELTCPDPKHPVTISLERKKRS